LVLAIHDKKALESSVKSAIRQIKLWTDFARNVIPRQGNTDEFAYGLISGIVIGAFTERFVAKNGRQPDMDEMADLFLFIRTHMPAVRRAILSNLESSM
jgi:hypothetical protein